MQYEDRAALRVRGCLLALATLLVGIVVGSALTLGLLGVSFGQLLSRAQGQPAGPIIGVPPVQLTPTPAKPAPIQGAAAPGRRLVWGSPIPLDTDTRDPDLLVISRNYDSEPDSDTIAYLSPATGSVRWESQPLGENGNSWVVAYGDRMIFVADGERLLALRRDSGELAWEAPLSDSIADGICRDCLQVFADVVVALPQDGQLQAFAIANGAPRWSVRLRETTRQLVRLGELVGVPDRMDKDNSSGALFLYRVADGSLADQIVPSCQRADSYPLSTSYYMHTGVSPDGGTLFWLLGGSPACLMSYDVATTTVSRTWLEQFDTNEITPRNAIWAGDTLYLSDTRRIYALGPQETRQIAGAEDYNLWPVAASADTLLVEARRSRGSTRYELWALDLRSGERRWERVLEADDPQEYVDDTADFAAAIVGDAVALVEQHEEPEQITFDLLGLADGASRVRTTLEVEDPDNYIRGKVWGQDHVFLSIDQLYSVELSTGRTTARWP